MHIKGLIFFTPLAWPLPPPQFVESPHFSMIFLTPSLTRHHSQGRARVMSCLTPHRHVMALALVVSHSARAGRGRILWIPSLLITQILDQFIHHILRRQFFFSGVSIIKIAHLIIKRFYLWENEWFLLWAPPNFSSSSPSNVKDKLI